MNIKNARILRGDKFVEGAISFEEKINGFEADDGIDAGGAYIVPGFIDVHTHGALGIDASDCTLEEIPKLASHYAAHGVTSFCFTTLTIPREDLRRCMKNIAQYRREGLEAKCAGVHLEGPFVSYAKRGAQNPDNIQAPNYEMLLELNELSGGQIRIISMAPEIDGALEFIEKASKVCTVSLGHSTANYEQAMAGFKAGAKHVTHLFNGMQPMHHRDPGLVGAAYMAGANVELICDGLHIHPAVIMEMHKLFGDRLIIISDSLRCAGMPDGEYTLGGLPYVMKDGQARLLDGTIAGSSSNLLDELRNVVSYGMPLEAAVKAMSEAPAKAIGRFDEIGSLEVGKCADFVVLDEQLQLKAVFIDGECVLGEDKFKA